MFGMELLVHHVCTKSMQCCFNQYTCETFVFGEQSGYLSGFKVVNLGHMSISV